MQGVFDFDALRSFVQREDFSVSLLLALLHALFIIYLNSSLSAVAL